MRRAKLRAFLHLVRWLSPVTPTTSQPADVDRRSVVVPAQGEAPAFEAWVYTPTRRRPFGSYLLLPGLHYEGPSDVRFDRFARILAGAGLVVLAPFLPDYLALRVALTVLRDAERAFDALRALPDRGESGRPGVFSISFGSLPAIRLAGAPGYRDQVGGLVVFGGFANWAETLRFALTGTLDGQRQAHHDPLNRPVIFMNVVDDLAEAPEDKTALLEAWRRYVRRTWGRAEMRVNDAYKAVARELAASVTPADRRLFLIGCGVESGALELVEAALARGRDRRAFVDPRPFTAAIRCPVCVLHGRGDDVIPYTQLAQLVAAMPDVATTRGYLTGLYAHVGVADWRERLKGLPAELWTMLAMVRAIVSAASG